MTFLCINGIGNAHGSGSTDLMRHELHEVRGIPAIDVNYKAVAWYETRFKYARRRVAVAIETAARGRAVPPIDIVAHSFACLGTIQAMRRGMAFRHIWFFGAAVDRDVDLSGLRFSTITNVVNRRDKALEAGGALWFHPIGKLGRDGYKGSDPRVSDSFWSDYDEGADDDWFNHSDYFRGVNLALWGDRIEAQYRA